MSRKYIIPSRNRLPSGELIGYKKVMDYKENYQGHYVIKLMIPKDALRSQANGRKCRCEKAVVLEIKNIGDGSTVDVITNVFMKPTIYKVGSMVYPDDYDKDYWKECSNGIHFFLSERDAIRYRMSTASPFNCGYASTPEKEYIRLIDGGGAGSTFVKGWDVHLNGGLAI